MRSIVSMALPYDYPKPRRRINPNLNIIGPHIIDADRHGQSLEALAKGPLTASMEHLTDPENKIFFLTMEGPFFKADAYALQEKQLLNLVRELELPEDVQPHFKDGHCDQGLVMVANNTYDERESMETRAAGHLAE